MHSFDEDTSSDPSRPDEKSRQSDEVLRAISDLQDSEALYRGRLRGILKLGSNDLAAAQFVSRRYSHGRVARAVDVTRSLGITSSATSVIVTRLVSRGFVSRNVDPRDHRVQTLRPTASLTAALAKAIGQSREEPERVLNNMSEREARRVVSLLSTVTLSLDKGALD